MDYLFLVIVILVVGAILAFASFSNFELDSEHYDRLKWVALHWDVLVVFVGLIVKLFDVPYGVETVSLVAGIGAALGGLLGISTKAFNEPIPVDVTGLKYIDAEEDEEDEHN